MVGEAVAACPLEGCGVLVGEPGGSRVRRFEPVANEAASDRLYRLDGPRFVDVASRAEAEGLDIIGVMHSHPTTASVPSDHDRATATGDLIPSVWHWVIVSLAGPTPVVRSYRRRGRCLAEEPIRLIDRPRQTDSAENRSTRPAFGDSLH